MAAAVLTSDHMVVRPLHVCYSQLLRLGTVRMLALCSLALALAGCVGQVAKTPPPTGQKSVSFGHVFIVVEENHNYSDVVASPVMPYLNGLANQYGLAANY